MSLVLQEGGKTNVNELDRSIPTFFFHATQKIVLLTWKQFSPSTPARYLARLTLVFLRLSPLARRVGGLDRSARLYRFSRGTWQTVIHARVARLLARLDKVDTRVAGDSLRARITRTQVHLGYLNVGTGCVITSSL